jgi:hypothetical protein
VAKGEELMVDLMVPEANKENVAKLDDSTEWLRLQRGTDNPFIQLLGRRPNSTTTTPNRDIDFLLTYGISVKNISTLLPNTPAHSDHLGIVYDLDLGSFFSSVYSEVCTIPPRALTSGNVGRQIHQVCY